MLLLHLLVGRKNAVRLLQKFPSGPETPAGKQQALRLRLIVLRTIIARSGCHFVRGILLEVREGMLHTTKYFAEG
jgi:hypothetical protein